jgi:hypothetical protein
MKYKTIVIPIPIPLFHSRIWNTQKFSFFFRGSAFLADDTVS